MMKRLGIVISGGLLVVGMTACTKAGSSDKKLDEISSELSKLKQKVSQLVPDAPAAPAAGAPGARGANMRAAMANNTPLGRIERRLARMEQMIARGGGMRGRQRPQMPRPDANTVYSVPLAGAAMRGPKSALVTVVKAFEFACPHCMRVGPTLDKIVETYGDKVRIAYKHYVVHPTRATIPALAACAANNQGKYHGMYKKIFSKFGRFGQPEMEGYAKELGLNMEQFKKDMEGACKQRVRQDQMELARVGVRGTPAFFINGRFLSGNQPFPNFQRLIDEELKKAQAVVAKGTAAASYYDEFVIKKGKKTL